MITIITFVHIMVCLFLVGLVLLQHGKGADIGATFGGGNTVFGSEGPVPMLNKITTAVAIVFMITSVTLAYLGANSGNGSVMEEVAAPVAIEIPAEPVETGPVKVPLPSDEVGQTQAPAEFPGQEK